jgi:hypothetical protein
MMFAATADAALLAIVSIIIIKAEFKAEYKDYELTVADRHR